MVAQNGSCVVSLGEVHCRFRGNGDPSFRCGFDLGAQHCGGKGTNGYPAIARRSSISIRSDKGLHRYCRVDGIVSPEAPCRVYRLRASIVADKNQSGQWLLCLQIRGIFGGGCRRQVRSLSRDDNLI